MKKSTALAFLFLCALAAAAAVCGPADNIDMGADNRPVPDPNAGVLYDRTAPFMGPEGAKAIIVEYSDFQCPYCSRMGLMIEEWREAAPGDIRVIWMDRPLISAMGEEGIPFHPWALLAHEACAEAQEQDRFWAMQQYLFHHRNEVFDMPRPHDMGHYAELQEEFKKRLVEVGEKTGLDAEKLEAALADRRHREKILSRVAMAEGLDIFATPTIFVNGKDMGADPDKIRRAIEKAIGKELP